MRHVIEVSCPVPNSFRVQQVASMFDVTLAERSVKRFEVDLPAIDDTWDIGLIVGPSGTGKSTIAREIMGEYLYKPPRWPRNEAILDGFPESLNGQAVCQTLSSVGFSSPPDWVKPFNVLSNGQQFRCDLARSLLSQGSVVVFDEFTSVVDRTVAKVGSAAVAKSIRSGRVKKKFVAVTCHYDVAEWLEPDWILDMATGQLARSRLQRPAIQLEIFRCKASAWELFKPHHYLTAELAQSAYCFMATFEGVPVGFDAWMVFFGKLKTAQRARRGHRTVVLPDYQGIGIGSKLFTTIASMWRGLGYRAFSCTAHPAEIRSRTQSPNWRMTRPPGRTARGHHGIDRRRATGRLTASFEYVGPAMARDEAEKLFGE